MTSERQIAANRRNAGKSTGPRSHAGKRRAARNSLKHGLAASITASTGYASTIDNLASEIFPETDDASIRECARIIAAAGLELDRIRRVRIGLFAQIFNSDDVRQDESLSEEKSRRRVVAREVGLQEIAEVQAVRRALPELVRIGRYERRASKRYDEAVRRLLQLRQYQNRQGEVD
jgi:hypothetical protein